MKYYAVKIGYKPGIYNTWDEAKAQVDGYSGARFKSFPTIEQAEEFMQDKDKIKKSNNTRQANHNYFAIIYTDGGCRNTGNSKGDHVHNTDKAAWAYLISNSKTGQNIYNSAACLGATNNQMELTALKEALYKLIELHYNSEHLLFKLDSKYVVVPIQTGRLTEWHDRKWHNSSGTVANKDLWKDIFELLKVFPYAEFTWVKGHAGHAGNEFVDQELNKSMDRL